MNHEHLILMEPVRLALQGIADRMQSRMMRAAYSSIAREGGDCAAAVFLPDGRLLAQARSLPLLLGSLIPAVAGLLQRCRLHPNLCAGRAAIQQRDGHAAKQGTSYRTAPRQRAQREGTQAQ